MSQILIELSEEPEATQVPSGWNLTELTAALWSVKPRIKAFDVTSHSFTCRSSEPETIRRVSGENSADLIQLECAAIENMNFRS